MIQTDELRVSECGTFRDELSVMDIEHDKTDDDNEPDASIEDSGPLGKHLEHEASRSIEEDTAAETRPPQPQFDPRTRASDYAKGTREHEDDREP